MTDRPTKRRTRRAKEIVEHTDVTDLFQPPEDLLDPNHIHTDIYLKDMKSLKGVLTSLFRQLGAKKYRVVELHHQGKDTKQIAAEANVSPATVRNVLKTEEAKSALLYMQAIHEMNIGPTLAMRTAMLDRIARANEHTKPSVAIQAIHELNLMQGTNAAAAAKAAMEHAPKGASVEITIKAYTTNPALDNIIEGDFTRHDE